MHNISPPAAEAALPLHQAREAERLARFDAPAEEVRLGKDGVLIHRDLDADCVNYAAVDTYLKNISHFCDQVAQTMPGSDELHDPAKFGGAYLNYFERLARGRESLSRVASEGRYATLAQAVRHHEYGAYDALLAMSTAKLVQARDALAASVERGEPQSEEAVRVARRIEETLRDDAAYRFPVSGPGVMLPPTPPPRAHGGGDTGGFAKRPDTVPGWLMPTLAVSGVLTVGGTVTYLALRAKRQRTDGRSAGGSSMSRALAGTPAPGGYAVAPQAVSPYGGFGPFGGGMTPMYSTAPPGSFMSM